MPTHSSLFALFDVLSAAIPLGSSFLSYALTKSYTREASLRSPNVELYRASAISATALSMLPQVFLAYWRMFHIDNLREIVPFSLLPELVLRHFEDPVKRAYARRFMRRAGSNNMTMFLVMSSLLCIVVGLLVIRHAVSEMRCRKTIKLEESCDHRFLDAEYKV
ncbi:hypothetical protein MD484_g5512, partial [Candolleomyces efflorescens]